MPEVSPERNAALSLATRQTSVTTPASKKPTASAARQWSKTRGAALPGKGASSAWDRVDSLVKGAASTDGSHGTHKPVAQSGDRLDEGRLSGIVAERPTKHEIA